MDRIRHVTLALTAVLAAACAGQPESPAVSPDVGATGTRYQLVAVDGQLLPATAYFGVDVAARATAGTLILAPDHTFTLRVDYTEHFASGNRDAALTLAQQGTWSAGVDALTLTPSGGSAENATLVGGQLLASLTVPGAEPTERATKPYAFKRQ